MNDMPQNGALARGFWGALLSISILVGLAGWINSIISPLSTRMDNLHEQITKNEDVTTRGINDRADIRATLATLTKMFAEVETQFKNIDERTKRMEDQFRKDFDIHAMQIQASQNDRLGLHGTIAGIQAKFAEIETQFKDAKEMAARDRADAFKSAEYIKDVLSTKIDMHANLIGQLGVFSLRGPDAVKTGR